MDNALLFIPDISGFTKFMTGTALEHSQIIITKLLELLINENRLNLKVAEVEGDAVLFYKKGTPPSFTEVLAQSKSMFIEFHKHIKVMENQRTCNCEACSNLTNLTLKFIVHYGESKEVTIMNFTKIMGSDVILAHRLLKNDIPSKEYLLVTADYIKNQPEHPVKKAKWTSFAAASFTYENFGEVKSSYINFRPLLDAVHQNSEN